MFAAIGIGLLWFASSALLSTWANTTFLRFFEDPILHTFIRFAGSAVLGVFILSITGQVKSFQQVFKTSKRFDCFILPNVCNVDEVTYSQPRMLQFLQFYCGLQIISIVLDFK